MFELYGHVAPSVGQRCQLDSAKLRVKANGHLAVTGCAEIAKPCDHTCIFSLVIGCGPEILSEVSNEISLIVDYVHAIGGRPWIASRRPIGVEKDHALTNIAEHSLQVASSSAGTRLISAIAVELRFMLQALQLDPVSLPTAAPR